MRVVRAIARRLRRHARDIFGPRTASAIELPGAETIDLGAPAVANDPFPHYERLRAIATVHYLPRHQGWFVLGYDEVQAAFANPGIFSNRPYAEVDAVLLGADPPEHTAVRRLVSQHFSPAKVAELSAFAEEQASRLVKPEMDAVSGYGVPLSDSVAAHLLGFDGDAVDAIRVARAKALGVAHLTSAIDAVADSSSMYGHFVAGGLDDASARSTVRLLWLAATTTTERAIARCILRLLQHPDVRARLTRDLTLVPAFVDEVLRLHPPEHVVPRLTTGEVVLGGVRIPEGSAVYLCVAAANRDPLRFDAPDSLLLERSGPRHFSFGHGIHHCIGASLGRNEVATAVRTLITAAPRFRSVASPGSVQLWSSMTANAIVSLPLKCAD